MFFPRCSPEDFTGNRTPNRLRMSARNGAFLGTKPQTPCKKGHDGRQEARGGGSGRVGSRQEREGTLPADSAGNTLGTTLKHTKKTGRRTGCNRKWERQPGRSTCAQGDAAAEDTDVLADLDLILSKHSLRHFVNRFR